MTKSAISRTLFFVLLVFITVACKKTYSVKIINNYPDAFSDLDVGPASFGTLASGSTSSYQEINEGSNALTGNDYTSNKKITGSVSMSGGYGKNTGTVTINFDGSLGFVVDKK